MALTNPRYMMVKKTERKYYLVYFT